MPFNQYLYQGEKRILPEKLQELDTTETIMAYGKSGAAVGVQKYRDVMQAFMTDDEKIYCILGIENQSKQNLAMPVRNLLYDSLQLSLQVERLAKENRKQERQNSRKNETDGYRKQQKAEKTNMEFLSGLKDTDRLVPVITLVILWKGEAWNGPRSIRELYQENSKALWDYAVDYRLNIIEPYCMSDEALGQFTTSLREVFLFIKYSADREKVRQLFEEDPGYRTLERKAVDVLNSVADARIKYSEGEEKINMCKEIQTFGFLCRY